MTRVTLGDQAVEVPFVIPVESAIATAISFVDSAGDPLDQSGSSWVVEVFDLADPATALLSMTPSVAVGTFTLTASEATVTAALGTRGRLRWRLRNTTISQDVIAGDVVRKSVGYGVRVGTGTGVTVQVTETSVTVQGPAATVVSGAANIDGGTASSIYGGTIGIDGGAA